jgi:hypothetical protein
MPKYRYAKTTDDNLIDVLELSHERTDYEAFLCIGCGEPLIAKTKGEQREKHFAHHKKVACNEETYLHLLAKKTFYDVYTACLASDRPFTINLTHPKACKRFRDVLGHSCHVGELEKTYDLTERFDKILMEKRDGEFVPDLLLFNSLKPQTKIYVEIAVTHFLSEAKADSPNRIIEIPIESEDDVIKLRECHLTEYDASFVNIERMSVSVPDAECACAFKEFACFFIYESGKCFMDRMTLTEFKAQRAKIEGKVKYMKVVTDTRQSSWSSHGELFQELVEEAHSKQFPVQNCFLCRYAGNNWNSNSEGGIYCKYHRRACNSNSAVECEIFRLK